MTEDTATRQVEDRVVLRAARMIGIVDGLMEDNTGPAHIAWRAWHKVQAFSDEVHEAVRVRVVGFLEDELLP